MVLEDYIFILYLFFSGIFLVSMLIVTKSLHQCMEQYCNMVLCISLALFDSLLTRLYGVKHYIMSTTNNGLMFTIRSADLNFFNISKAIISLVKSLLYYYYVYCSFLFIPDKS